ncbi:MAG: pseudouridine synthase [Candidatus Azobacteroides sp.]|nr:pseudouridine synthase [Candidatus Azobacteroides sp.]
MTTEGNDRNNYGRNDEGTERRPYSNNREGYGNNDYNRSYNRSGNDNRRGSGYGNRDNYDRPQQNRFDRPQRIYSSNGNSNYQGGGNSQRYSSSNESGNGMDAAKKRRPRVGDARGGDESYGNPRSQGGYANDRAPQRNYGNRDDYRSGGNSYGGGRSQGGGYGNNRQQGGYGNNRQQGAYGNGGGYGNNRQQGNNRPQRNNNIPNNKYGVQKQLKYREENFDPNEPIRLNKYLANAGVCSRREADEFIKAGVVSVNGDVVNELGVKVKRADKVMFHNQPVKLEQKIYVLLNKPKNCVTTADDPQERLTVMDLVKGACHERIFPVGRLDRNTTGVLLLTNDGDLASKLTHPKFLKKKIYHVWLDKPVTIEDMQKIAEGIDLDDGEIHADAISYISDVDKDQIGIEIHSGRNRIVRRIFETLGYHVMKLDRVYFAGLTKKQLKRGQWRYLTEREVNMLRMGAFE